MFCHVREQMEPYLDQLLDSARRAAFERHVAACASCRSELAEAREAGRCMSWLVPEEAPPQPRPGFYFNVQRSIERETGGGWLAGLAATMRLRLAYPAAVLCLLLVAWTLTQDSLDGYDGLTATEYPATDFVSSSFARADGSHDLVMMTLVDLPDDY